MGEKQKDRLTFFEGQFFLDYQIFNPNAAKGRRRHTSIVEDSARPSEKWRENGNLLHSQISSRFCLENFEEEAQCAAEIHQLYHAK